MREDDLNKHVAEARAALYVAEKTMARQRVALEQGRGGGVPSGELLFFRLPVKVFVYLSGFCEVGLPVQRGNTVLCGSLWG